MNDDAKKILKEKLSALANDEELDNVAGGSMYQNYEILNAMYKIDPDGVHDILSVSATAGTETMSQILVAQGAKDLIQKHFVGIDVYPGVLEKNNIYRHNGQTITHNEILGMINQKIKVMQDTGFDMV